MNLSKTNTISHIKYFVKKHKEHFLRIQSGGIVGDSCVDFIEEKRFPQAYEYIINFKIISGHVLL